MPYIGVERPVREVPLPVYAFHCLRHRLLRHPIRRNPPHERGKLRLIHGLEQIVCRLKGNRLFCVIKLGVACEKDELWQDALRACMLCHRNAVHTRHTNVGEHNVGMLRAQEFEPRQTVERIAHNAASHPCPVNHGDQSPTDDLLILNDQNTQHCPPPFQRSRAAPS